MYFKDVIGHYDLKQKLIQTAKDGRISHAQLFLGPEGCGKKALAIAYAQYICCEGPKPDDSCGKCHSCLKYAKLIHPDLHFVFPVTRTTKFTKPVSDDYITYWRNFMLDNPYQNLNSWMDCIGTENQQAGIYVQESQEILRKLNLKTFESEYKVMIIWFPERMNVQTSNKLLKMIEEPPPKTLFLLVSENEEEIISTIRSRTQLVKIPKINGDEMALSLKDQFDLPDEEIWNIVRIANGNYALALDVLKSRNSIKNGENDSESSVNINYFEYFARMMRLCFAAKVLDIFVWIGEITNLGREQQKQFFNYSLRMIRENFILNLLPRKAEKIVFLANEEADFSRKFSAYINQNNIFQIAEELEKASYHIERNAYDKIVFLDLSLKLMKLLKA